MKRLFNDAPPLPRRSSPPAVYELQGTGADGSTKYFHKPWAMTTVMFMGMTFCLPLAFIQQVIQLHVFFGFMPPNARDALRS